jgi:hypothetical protein
MLKYQGGRSFLVDPFLFKEAMSSSYGTTLVVVGPRGARFQAKTLWKGRAGWPKVRAKHDERDLVRRQGAPQPRTIQTPYLGPSYATVHRNSFVLSQQYRGKDAAYSWRPERARYDITIVRGRGLLNFRAPSPLLTRLHYQASLSRVPRASLRAPQYQHGGWR